MTCVKNVMMMMMIVSMITMMIATVTMMMVVIVIVAGLQVKQRWRQRAFVVQLHTVVLECSCALLKCGMYYTNTMFRLSHQPLSAIFLSVSDAISANTCTLHNTQRYAMKHITLHYITCNYQHADSTQKQLVIKKRSKLRQSIANF